MIKEYNDAFRQFRRKILICCEYYDEPPKTDFKNRVGHIKIKLLQEILVMESERRSKMMANDWEKASYIIQVCLDGQIISCEVAGVVKNGFGIHETNGAWNITHLATGFNCLSAADFDGAEIVARYLIANYLPEFERLRITGTTLENYRPLEERITTDGELFYLKKLYGDDRTETKNREKRMIMMMKIIS